MGASFTDAVGSGRLDLPLPGSGRTRARWAGFELLAYEDLSLARLGEGHADAVAILAELGGPPPPAGSRWGVWAAEPPTHRLTAAPADAGWRLDGPKAFCSGARDCTHALVTAQAADGPRLFAVRLDQPGVSPVAGSWPAVGMADSDSRQVDFRDAVADPVGPPGAYVDRPGFWHGAMGVAACWYGGALAVGHALADAAARRDVGPHALAHLGAVDAGLTGVATLLDAAAAEVDADPRDLAGTARLTAARLRAVTETVATSVLDRVGRALGAAPLCLDAGLARHVADLTVYLRQSHAERDLAELGALIAARGPTW